MHARTPILAAFSASVLPLLAACSSGPGMGGVPSIDGDLADWRGKTATVATPDAVYFRFSPGTVATVQAHSETTRLVFDLDDSPATGKALSGPPEIGTLGIDLEILMSPPSAGAGAGRTGPTGLGTGVSVMRHDGPSASTRLGHADVGFVAGPTYANDWFEARLDRHAPALANTGLTTAGRARGLVLVTDAAGSVLRYSDPLEFVLPDLNRGDRLATVPIPQQPKGTIRVLSLNVLRGKPATEPAAFARLVSAIKPDVILLQEADDMSAEDLEAWLSGFVGVLPSKHEWAEGVQSLAGGVGAWDAASLPGSGVAIATPHVLTGVYEDAVEIADPRTQRPRSVRALMAVVSTPLGDVLACSTHLKCCGSGGSEEDLIRYAEAGAVNERFGAVADALVAGEGRRLAARVIGGDLNLVGTRGPIDILRAGLAGNGGDLQPAATPVLGGDAWYTWRDDRSAFAPGRLDWILTGDASVVRSFAVDTRLTDPATLAGQGLEPGDSGASDHLAVVVDLRP